MNTIIIYVALGLGIVIFLPITIIIISWLKSFKRYALFINPSTEDLNKSDISMVKCKVKKHLKFGEIITFFPRSGYDFSKRFESRYWQPLKIGKKVYQCIILHAEHDNYRPVELKNNTLHVSDIDNSEFLLFKDHAKFGWNDENRLYTIIIISFILFVLFFGLACVVAMIYMMHTNVADYAQIAVKGVAPIA